MSTFNNLFEKIKKFGLYAEDWESGTFSELAVIGTICRCAMAEKRIRQRFFFRHFLTLLM